VPYQWQLTGNAWAVIFPLSVVCACHILFPVRLSSILGSAIARFGIMLLETFAILCPMLPNVPSSVFFSSAFGHLTTPFLHSRHLLFLYSLMKYRC
jgi:hypothetical protein